MKKSIKFTKELDLGKVDVADLSSSDLSKVNGGLTIPPTQEVSRCETQCSTCNNCTFSCQCTTSVQQTMCTCITCNATVCKC